MAFSVFGKEINIKIEIVIIGVVLLAIIIGTIGFIVSRNEGKLIINKAKNELSTDIKGNDIGVVTQKVVAANVEGQSKTAGEIKVYVVGCVNKEGLVTLEKGQLIDDAIRAAGGLTQKADFRNINMAYELTENVMLKIKSIDEVKQVTAGIKTSQPVKDGVKIQPGVEIIKDSAGAIVNESIKDNEANKKININTATVEELDTLTGIGVATAQKIITYREKSGIFKVIEDIKNVSGIGESKFNAIKDFITVE